MATIEQVEKLREKANVSYTEAKEALEKCNDDLLDAILYLEEQGKVKSPETGGQYKSDPAYSVKQNEKTGKKNHWHHEHHANYEGKDDFQSLWSKFWRWCKVIIGKGCVNTFEVYRHGESVIRIPVIIFVLLLCFAFWVTVPLLVVGLFFGFKYLFGGPDLSKTDLNKAMDVAADAAQNAKSEIKAAAENHQKNSEE